MGPLGMAEAECANMTTNGGCLGIPACCLGAKVTYAKPLDMCLLASRKARCHYFEKVVLPLAGYYPEYVPVVKAYKRRLPKEKPLAVEIKGMWTCDCGKPMAKGRKMCDVCAAKKRKESNRQAQAKRRGRETGILMSAVSIHNPL